MKKIIILTIIACILASLSVHAMSKHEALRHAADKGDLQRIKEIIKESNDHREIIKLKDHHGTPLHCAASSHNYKYDYGDTAVMQYLVEHGFYINALDTVNSFTPLHYAAIKNQLKPVQYLVEHGANINALDFKKTTPLDNALDMDRLRVAPYLICARDYIENREITLPQNPAEIVPKYCLLAVIKHNPCDIDLYFDPTFDYSYAIKYMQLPEDKQDGLYELMWRDLEHKKSSKKKVNDLIVKNKIGFGVLVRYKLHETIKLQQFNDMLVYCHK